MIYLTRDEVKRQLEDGAEEAICLKFTEDNLTGDRIELWKAEDGDIIRYMYKLQGEEGYFLHIIMDGYGFLENLHTKSVVEACNAFNTILKTIKA